MKKKFIMFFLLCMTVYFSIVHAQNYSISAGILNFIDSDKAKNRGENIASALSSELFKYKFIKLVERSMMKESIKEIELGQSGLVDESTAVKIGKMQGIQLMILGNIDKNGISARVVHVETQKIVTANKINDMSQMDELAKNLARGIETFLASESVRKMDNDNPDIDLEFWAEKKSNGSKLTYRGKASIGDSLVFHFRADRDGYITIIDIQSSGDIVVLFPNDSSPENKVKANVGYIIPSEEDNFEIIVTEPGTDMVAAFFTVKKADWLDREQLTGKGLWTVKDNEKMEMTRGLSVKKTGLKRSEWKTKRLEIEIVK